MTSWQIHETCAYLRLTAHETKRKICGLDLDHTLIRTASGNKFPKDPNDWTWMFPEIPQILKDYHSHPDYQLIIFSNQAGIKDNRDKLNLQIQKLNAIFAVLGFGISTYLSLDHDKWRKPYPFMFGLATSNPDLGLGPNPSIPTRKIDKFVYIGDAAGRSTDFSDSDYKFAINVQEYYGIPTYFDTPEHAFGISNLPNTPFTLSGFNPVNYPASGVFGMSGQLIAFFRENARLPLKVSNQMILMVGRQGSGKSQIAKHLEGMGYGYVNQDTCKTAKKCQDLTRQFLSTGKSVVIDNTNPSIEARKEYLSLGRQFGYSILVFELVVPKELNEKLDILRTILDPTKSRLSSMAFRMYDSRYQTPTLDEGFDKIYHFGFDYQSVNPQMDRLYYLLT
jgi:bifunctional polynucleotide phosphatase/kinase